MKKYQYGNKVDLSNLYGSNPLLDGYINNANKFNNQFSSNFDSYAQSLAGPAPTKMTSREFAASKGFNADNPFNIFKKGYGKLEKQYREYENQFQSDLGKHTEGISQLSGNMGNIFGGISTLLQGMKGQQAYDMSQANQDQFHETQGFQGYQDGGNIESMTQEDPWLAARSSIESSGNQNAVSSAGAVGQFQITPIGLKEYNRKYDSKYTWDQIKTNPVANAHVSQGLIKDIRSMINKVDTTMSEFDKNIVAEMAYNYGPYRMIDKIKSKGKDVKLEDLINDSTLPLETRNHGKKFIKHFNKESTPTESPSAMSSQIKRFTGDPYEYKKEGDKYYYRKGGEFKEINEAGRKVLKSRGFQYGGFVAPRDSMMNTLGALPIPQDTPYQMVLDPKKYLVAKETDSTLLRSGIKRIYDRSGKQIGWQNAEGQFTPLAQSFGLPRFEGKQSSFNPSVQNRQEGGNVNTTGYLPGSPTENNPYNIIPGGNITMQGVKQDINAIPMNSNGEPIGRPVRMKPGLNYFFPNANSVLEIPQGQFGGPAAMLNSPPVVNILNDPLGLTRRQQLGDPQFTQRAEMPLSQNVYEGPAPVDVNGFLRIKGDNWMYKDNGDGSYTVVDSNRPDQSFRLNKNSKNQNAYNRVAQLFTPRGEVSQPVATRSATPPFSGVSFAPQQVNTTRVDIPVRDLQVGQKYAPQPVSSIPQYAPQQIDNTYMQNAPLDAPARVQTMGPTPGSRPMITGPTSTLSPYQGSNIGATSIGEGNFKNLKNLNSWSNKIPDSWNAAVQIAPVLRALGLGKAAVTGTIKEMFVKKALKKQVGEQMSKKIANKLANKAYNEGAKYGPQYFQHGGEVQLVPIQTEKGEMFSHLDGSISKTGAKKLHKHMPEDEITDIVVTKTFVASRDPEMRISKKEADNIILGNHAMKYEQGKPIKPPKDIRLGDIMTKKYYTPADFLKRIDKVFPISTKENNIFTQTANEQNLESRAQYVDVIKYLTEAKKPAQLGTFKYGGNVKKYQAGAIIGALGSLIPQIMGMIQGSGNKNATIADIDKYQKENQGYVQNNALTSGLSNVMGYASQDYTPEIYDPSQVLQEVSSPYNRAMSSIPLRQEQNLALGRGMANDAYNRLSGSDPRMAYAAASTIGSNNFRQASSDNMRLNEQRDQMGISLGSQRANILRESLLNRQATLAGTRSARNQGNAGLFGNFAQIGSEYYGGMGNVNNTALAAKMGARGQYANFVTNMGYGLSNSLSNLGQGIAGLGRTQQPSTGYPPQLGGYTTPNNPGGLNRPTPTIDPWPRAQLSPVPTIYRNSWDG